MHFIDSEMDQRLNVLTNLPLYSSDYNTVLTDRSSQVVSNLSCIFNNYITHSF